MSNLPFNVQEKHLKKVFQKAVSISIPQGQGKAKGCVHVHWPTLFLFPMKKVFECSQETNVICCRFAFVEFAAAADAEKALQSSKDIKICNRPVKVQFCNTQGKSETAKGMWDCSYFIICGSVTCRLLFESKTSNSSASPSTSPF